MADEPAPVQPSDDSTTPLDEAAEEQAIWAELEAEEPAGSEDAEAGDAGDTETPGDTDTGEPASELAADIWTTATPEQRAAFEATRTERDDLQGRHDDLAVKYRRVGGTVSGLQKKTDRLQGELDAAKGGDAGDGSQDDGPANLTAIFEAPEVVNFAETYPEVAGPFLGTMRRVAEALERRASQADLKIEDLSEDRRTNALATQAEILTAAHPDWYAVQASEEFIEWESKQPAYVCDAINESNDGESLAAILSSFKQSQQAGGNGSAEPSEGVVAPGTPEPSPPLTDKRQAQLASSAYPRGKGTAKVQSGVPAPHADPEVVWAYYEERERLQQQEGATQ